MFDCRTCRHANLASDDAIMACDHPFFEQPMPATLLSPPERRFIINCVDGRPCQHRLVEHRITDCPLYEAN